MGGRSRHGHVGLRPLPAVLQADGDMPRRRGRRTAAARARSCSSGVRRRIRCSRRSSRPPSRRVIRVPTTSTATARRASPGSTATSAAVDVSARRGAYLHPVMDRPNLTVTTRALVHRVLFDGTRATGVDYSHGASDTACRGQRGRAVRRRVQLTATAAAVGRRRCRPPPRRSASIRCTDLPGGRRAPAGPSRGLHPARVHAAGVDAALADVVEAARSSAPSGCSRRGPGATNHFEAGGFARIERRRRVPQPDVPLPADRDPLRRVVTGRAATATRSTSGRCTPTPAAR